MDSLSTYKQMLQTLENQLALMKYSRNASSIYAGELRLSGDAYFEPTKLSEQIEKTEKLIKEFQE